MLDELSTMDATAQGELVRRGEATPLELVDAAIERIEKLNPRLNAVVIPLFDKARAIAKSNDLPDGPFRGVPFLIKDLGCTTAGDPHHSGMRLLKEAGWTADRNTYLADRFKRAGFIILGRTNTPELGFDGVTEPISYGPTRNPWNPERTPGGSSGGSAAAVASGMVAAAHGSDAGGSIRNPAGACGLVGLKPSRGRTSPGPEAGEIWGGLGVEHALTRSVRDTAAILDAVAGPMPGDFHYAPPPARPFLHEVGRDPKRLRIGLMAKAPAGSFELPPEVAEAARETGRLLESLGHDVEESWPEAIDSSDPGATWFTMVCSVIAREIDLWSEALGRSVGKDDIELGNWTAVQIGQGFSARDYLEAREAQATLAQRTCEWWARGFDLLLTPTIGMLPAPIGEFQTSPDNPLEGFIRTAPIGAYTVLFNMTGQPAISLPLHWSSDDLPIGIQLAAAFGREDLLIRVASQLEEARPWSDRLPSIHA